MLLYGGFQERFDEPLETGRLTASQRHRGAEVTATVGGGVVPVIGACAACKSLYMRVLPLLDAVKRLNEDMR